MKTIKLNSILLLAVTFLVLSCGQTQENTTSESEATTEQGQTEANSESTEVVQAPMNSEQTSGILNAYLEMKDALVQSSVDAAKKAAEEIKNILNGKSDSELLKGILEDAKQITEAKEVDQVRTHFDGMSQNVYELVKASNPDKTIYKQYCPMAFDNQGAFWLSSEEEIKNPYFGDKMLKCGKVQETLTTN